MKIATLLAAASLMSILPACVSQEEQAEISGDPEVTDETAEAEAVTDEVVTEDFSAGSVEDYSLEDDKSALDVGASGQEGSFADDMTATPAEGMNTETTVSTTEVQPENTDVTPVEDVVPAQVSVDTAVSEATPTVEAPATGGLTHVVVSGDTLSAIAKKMLGSAYKWQELATMNQIANPHLIFPGQTIVVDAAHVSQL